jgi:large subunit ribosomal protein L21
MQYAVIKTGGKQYKVSKGDVIDIDRLSEKGKEVLFSEVLLFVNDNQVLVGKPNLSNVSVKAEVLEDIKGEKLRVSKFKAKARYRRVMGFRSSLTRLAIKDILSGSAKVEKIKKSPQKPKAANEK